MKTERITSWVEIDSYDGKQARLLFEQHEPMDRNNTQKRCSPGYVTISLEGADAGVFMASQIRRALDEIERVEKTA